MTDRLYISRKEGGETIDAIEDCVDVTIQELEKYTRKTKTKKKKKEKKSDFVDTSNNK